VRGDYLPKSRNVCHFGAAFQPPGTDWREILLGEADGPKCPSAVPNFTRIGATSHPCGAKMLIFWPVSKFNTGTLPLRGFLPVTKKTYKHHIFEPTADARCLVSPNFAWW